MESPRRERMKGRNMRICDISKCTGCGACAAVCPTHAISMAEDAKGFYVPETDGALCIQCGRCEAVCPSNRREEPEKPRALSGFAAVHTDGKIRMGSSSGGVFAALADAVLRQDGAVCGCVLDDALKVKHVVGTSPAAIRRMQGSKYVQSSMENCFTEIPELLKAGKRVLFVGTSCQAAGLRAVLDAAHLPDDNLLLVDLVCHGVPSPKLWRDYLEFYRRHMLLRPIDYVFRGKKYGWGRKKRFGGYECTAVLGKRFADRTSMAVRLWDRVLSSDLALRNCCHACGFASVNKPSDLTLGDFWGIETVLPDVDDGRGCSCVLVHTAKGLRALEELPDVKLFPVEPDSIVSHNPNLCHATPLNPLQAQFDRDYPANGFSFAAKKYFGYTGLNRGKNLLKPLLFAIKLRKRL